MTKQTWSEGLNQLRIDIFNGESIRELRFHSLLVPFVYIIFTVILFFIFIVITFLFADDVSFPLPLLVFLSGALGGVINNYRRLSHIPQGEAQKNSTLTEQQALIAIFQIYVTPLIGGLFGVLLYTAFMTGIIQSILHVPFLPEITAKDQFTGVINLFKQTGPSTNKDAILIILWAFVAGFSEKMVPNFLDKLAEQFKDKAVPTTKKPNAGTDTGGS